jgi:hypothetical protein
MLDELAKWLMEIVAYGTGRIILTVLTPHIKIQLSVQEPKSSKRRWWSMSPTFTRGSKRYYHDTTVALVGLLFWILIGAAIAFAYQ